MQQIKKIEENDLYYKSFSTNSLSRIPSINLSKEKEFIKKHDDLLSSGKGGLYRGYGLAD